MYDPRRVPDPVRELCPGEWIRHFRVLDHVGQGTFGHVYRVLDARHRVVRALEVLHPHMGHYRARFLREGRALAELRGHPHVVGMVGLIDEPDAVALVLEYVGGPTLRDVIGAVGDEELDPLDSPHLQLLGAGIIDGVRGAHRLGILHRDLEPDNILLPRRGVRVPIAKVADFGLGKDVLCAVDAGLTTPGPMGSPEYGRPSSGWTPRGWGRRPTCGRSGRCSTSCARGCGRFAGAVMPRCGTR